MADDDAASTDNVPQFIRRPDDTPPADAESAQEDAEEKALKEQRETYAKMQADQVKKIQESIDKYKSQTEPMINDIYNSLATQNATPTDQPSTSLTDEYKQEMAKNTQQHGMDAVGSIFALVSMGLLLFGKKRGWKTAGIYQGLGNAMELYSKGKEEQSRDQQSKTLQLIKMMHEENSERLAMKREVLSEKRLTTTQKMDMLKTHHDMFEEQRQQWGDEQKALQGESNMIAKQEQALKSLRWLKYKYHTDTSHMLKSKDARAWAEYVRVETGGQLDPMRSDEEAQAADKMYPLHDYITQRTEVGKADEKGKLKGMPALVPSQKSPEETRQQKAKEWWDTQ